eukprot:5820017-Amphidinium_carterae.1
MATAISVPLLCKPSRAKRTTIKRSGDQLSGKPVMSCSGGGRRQSKRHTCRHRLSPFASPLVLYASGMWSCIASEGR